MVNWKFLKRRWRAFRNGLARRFFETRYGRELLVSSLPDRVIQLTTDCGDHVLTFSPHDYIGRKVYRKGHFEREGIARLMAVLEAQDASPCGKVLLELGGNIGTQTIYWARTGLFRRILTVEPDPRNFAFLSRNIIDNGLSDLVVPVNLAAGDHDGTIDFFQNPVNHGKSSALRSSPRDRCIRVPVHPVETLLDAQGLTAADIGLVWMDIEGYEPVACRSMETVMRAGAPLYMEFSPDFYGPVEAGAFRQMLANFYSRAFLFSEDHPVRSLLTTALPLDCGQYDVLLLP